MSCFFLEGDHDTSTPVSQLFVSPAQARQSSQRISMEGLRSSGHSYSLTLNHAGGSSARKKTTLRSISYDLANAFEWIKL